MGKWISCSDGNGSNGTRAAIYSQDKYGVTVDGLKLENTVLYSDGSGFGLEIFGNASGWEVKNNIIDNCGVDALGFSSDNGRFSHFMTTRSKTVARCYSTRLNVTFDNVQIYNNTMAGQGNWPAHATMVTDYDWRQIVLQNLRLYDISFMTTSSMAIGQQQHWFI